MTATRGRLMLIYSGTVGNSQLIAGVRNTSLTMNNQVVDVSTKDTDGWRSLLEDGSLKFFSVSCDGIFQDTATDELLRSRAFSNSINPYVFQFPNGDTIECNFQITGYTRTGGFEGAETFSLSFESTGEPTFTAAP